jgi:hypothetical protein
MDRRKRAFAIALVLLAGFLIARPYLYTYVVWPLLAKGQAWQGVVTTAYERQYGPYGMSTYHWRVQCDDGQVRTADVSLAIYAGVHPGATVRKIRGERYPRPVGPPNGFTLLQQRQGEAFPKELRPLVPVER